MEPSSLASVLPTPSRPQPLHLIPFILSNLFNFKTTLHSQSSHLRPPLFLPLATSLRFGTLIGVPCTKPQALQPYLNSITNTTPSQLTNSFASLFSNEPLISPSFYPPTSWKDGKPALSIPKPMLDSSKESFSFAVIGRFFGKRPPLEWVEQKTRSWNLSMPCAVSLTIKGNFIFGFNSLYLNQLLQLKLP